MTTFVLRSKGNRLRFAQTLTDAEQALREHAAQDPVVTTGTGTIEFGQMAMGHVRPHR